MELGEKIKELRNKQGLTQEELADRAELSKGFISQLERDMTSPSIATLEDLLQCLGTTLGEFFNEEQEEEQIVFTEEDFFVKKDEEYKNQIKTFPILCRMLRRTAWSRFICFWKKVERPVRTTPMREKSLAIS